MTADEAREIMEKGYKDADISNEIKHFDNLIKKLAYIGYYSLMLSSSDVYIRMSTIKKDKLKEHYLSNGFKLIFYSGETYLVWKKGE